MNSYTFVLVDVFTERPLAGNQLAVILNAEGLDDGQLQATAREFNYSETTFILPPRQAKADRRLRSFTPKAEVFGIGHHTLGAWWALAARGGLDLRDPETKFWQEIGESVLPVAIASEGGEPLRVAMTQDKPHFGDKLTDLAGLAHALGIEVSDFDLERLEPQAVSTGAMHLLTPVRSLSVLERVRVDAERLVEVARPLGCEGCYLFSLETSEPNSAAHARAFFPGIGISEDPATGSAAGPLGALLASRGLLPEGAWSVIEQGDEIERPSRIEVRVSGGQVEVRVSENLCKRTKWSKQPYFRKDSEPCPFNQNRRHPNSIRNLSISCSPVARQPERLKTSSKTSARHSLKAPSMAN